MIGYGLLGLEQPEGSLTERKTWFIIVINLYRPLVKNAQEPTGLGRVEFQINLIG